MGKTWPKNGLWLATLRAWYRLQKPLSPEYTKELRKNTKSPFPRVGARKYEKKKPPKNTKMVIFGAIFAFFRYFFRIFGPIPERGILYFFRNFFVFSGLRGFCNLYQARRVASQSPTPKHLLMQKMALKVIFIF